ncbi:MAG: FAD binding domain-containing protein [Bacteroidales bacterium]|nr:FAD binding domain-containing protein [Bacteroidales bacterium]
MIEFILNDKIIKTEKHNAMVLLDFIRNEQNLKGTKSGCKEGDCGACTVLEGTYKNGEMVYKTIVSCLTPLANAEGKHIVTIEGLNQNELTPIQKAFVDQAATQCGFCTPGFIVSFSNFALSDIKPIKSEAINSVAGNICRCTGYKSIEKAAEDISNNLKTRDLNNKIDWLIQNKYVPEYFKNIPEKIKNLKIYDSNIENKSIIAGGTDLYVQKPEKMLESEHTFISKQSNFKTIEQFGNICEIGAAVTISELEESNILNKIFPDLKDYIKLISSLQIRNMATLAGNFVNASPIGDLTIFFLALNSKLHIVSDKNIKREIYLKDFFEDYKKVDLNNGEIIEKLSFEIPSENHLFNFEKISKRTHLDIASVNSAISLSVDNEAITKVYLSAGGLAAIPKYFEKTCEFLKDKKISSQNIKNAAKIAVDEVSPISDIRGSKEYKLLLFRQLIYAHFIKLFPEKISINKLSEID